MLLSFFRIFSSVRAVLQGACHMVALQIACEPLVRQTVRQVFQTRAVLCVRPTKKGRKVCCDTLYMYMVYIACTVQRGFFQS